MRSALVYFFLITFFPHCLSGQEWETLEVEIDDDFNAVIFYGENGLLAGDQGLYVTISGGQTAEDWNRFEIAESPILNEIFDQTKWNDCFSALQDNNVFLTCGVDTVNNRPILVRIDMPSLDYSILYYGEEEEGALNGIGFNPINDRYYAVGDGGLIVSSNGTDYSFEPIESLTSDLRSIDWSGNKFIISAADYFIRGIYDSNGFNAEIDFTPGRNYNCAIIDGAISHSVGNGIFTGQNLNIPSESFNYDFGELEGRDIYRRGTNKFYIGTSHGIFAGLQMNSISPILEWQPSSGNTNINGIWTSYINPWSQNSYACGDDGLLLFTSQIANVMSWPFCLIEPSEGACINTTLYVSYITKGSGTSCKWLIDGEQVSNTCFGISVPTDQAGTFEVTFVSSNFAGADSSTTFYTIVEPPQVDIPFTISDTILCHEESIEISLESSQTNIIYLLLEESGDDFWGQSDVGSGSEIFFQSLPISQDVHFLLAASHVDANCLAYFTDTISIEVEHTLADFHFDLINAAVNEEVIYHQNSVDAQNFAWTFGEGSSEMASGDPEVLTSYNQSGSTWAELICWSNNGCYDSIVKEGPLVFVPEEEADSCWINVNFDVDQAWQGFYVPDIADISLVKDGVLTCGKYSNMTLASRYGNDYFLEGRGGFLAKTDTSGVLKWVVHSEQEVIPTNFAFMTSVVEDSEGNIYVSGRIFKTRDDNTSYVRDNRNKPIESRWNTYLLKLDSRGGVIWSYSFPDFIVTDLSVDNSDNLFIIFHDPGQGGQIDWMIFNETDTVYAPTSVNWVTDKFMKMSPEGEPLWAVDMFNDHVNGAEIERIEFDADNNVYVAGNFEIFLTVYDMDGQEEPLLEVFDTPSYGSKGYILKYDSLGNFDWSLACITQQDSPSKPAWIADMVTDNEGNIYITGGNEYYPLGETIFMIHNSDGTTTANERGAYYLAKINSEGTAEWVEGHTRTHHGSGGYNISLHGNKLVVVGAVRDVENIPGHFTSSDGATLELQNPSWAYFIADYTTDGVLERLCLSALDPEYALMLDRGESVIGKNGEIYLLRNLIFGTYGNGEIANYEQFGMSVTIPPEFSQMTGLLLRVDPNCGHCFFPEPGDVQNVKDNYNQSIRYYPNPTSGQVFFEFEEDGEWEEYSVLNITGQLIKTGRLSDPRRFEITLPHPAGIYLIQFTGSNGSIYSVPIVKY